MAELTELQKQLFELQDIKYRDFHSKLMPETVKEKIIGIRTPVLRKFAKVFAGTPELEDFLQQLPHQFYEENNLHMMLITGIKDYPKCMEEVLRFLPYIDNWATCDLLVPRAFQRHLPELYEKILHWLSSSHPYTVRFGIGMLLHFYLEDAFCPDHLALVSQIRSDEYYVNMMIAWYFATALVKQYDATLPYLAQARLARWTHNKAIQKAIESDRIAPAQKVHLRTLKLK